MESGSEDDESMARYFDTNYGSVKASISKDSGSIKPMVELDDDNEAVGVFQRVAEQIRTGNFDEIDPQDVTAEHVIPKLNDKEKQKIEETLNKEVIDFERKIDELFLVTGNSDKMDEIVESDDDDFDGIDDSLGGLYCSPCREDNDNSDVKCVITKPIKQEAVPMIHTEYWGASGAVDIKPSKIPSTKPVANSATVNRGKSDKDLQNYVYETRLMDFQV